MFIFKLEVSVHFLLTSDVQPTVCQYQYELQSASSALGVFIPRCKPDGSYDDVQCRGSVCFCADRRGHELQGSRVSIGEGSPQCATPGEVTLLCRRVKSFRIIRLGHNFDDLRKRAARVKT